jgi:hypothetical protein
VIELAYEEQQSTNNEYVHANLNTIDTGSIFLLVGWRYDLVSCISDPFYRGTVPFFPQLQFCFPFYTAIVSHSLEYLQEYTVILPNSGFLGRMKKKTISNNS